MTLAHPLKSPWKLMHLPNLSKEVVKEKFNDDWPRAQREMLKVVDDITTIEEMWSTFNSLPKIHLFPPHDVLILSRNALPPSYESLPQGHRLQFLATTAESATVTVDLILTSVLGEQCTQKTGGASYCEIIRMSHKPGMNSKDGIKVDVWLNSGEKAAELKQYFVDLFKRKLEERKLENTVKITDHDLTK